MSGPIVGPAEWVSHCVCKLVLDDVGTDLQIFLKHSPGRRSETVPGHHFFVKTHSTQRCQHSVVAHWTCSRTMAREDIFPGASQGLCLFENHNGLRRQGD